MFKVAPFIFGSILMATAMAITLPDTTAMLLSAKDTGSHQGRATFFFQGGNAGACGAVHQDTDHVVALETTTYADGQHCGKSISITDSNTGKTVTAIVADECPGCGGQNNIDLSVGLFTQFAGESVGVFPVVWKFV